MVVAFHYKTAVYLLYQAAGQFTVIYKTEPIADFRSTHSLSARELESLAIIDDVKKFSVDSLGYKPTNNYTHLYDDRSHTILWVVTASEPYALTPYTWRFPFLGELSYKGFFKKELATIEYNHLVCQGYDADIRPVSAWSTLGWLNDPILLSTLQRNKGSLCNLFFHELFHATYYAPGSAELNENLANFVAHKATCRFLSRDTSALRIYLAAYEDRETFARFMFRRMQHLQKKYREWEQVDGKYLLKLREIVAISDSVGKLPLRNRNLYLTRQSDILRFKNAYFVDFIQYDSKQDSLNEAFNKFYGGKIENLVRYLKQN